MTQLGVQEEKSGKEEREESKKGEGSNRWWVSTDGGGIRDKRRSGLGGSRMRGEFLKKGRWERGRYTFGMEIVRNGGSLDSGASQDEAAY